MSNFIPPTSNFVKDALFQRGIHTQTTPDVYENVTMDSTSIFRKPSPSCHSLCNETYMQSCTQPDNSKAQISSPHTPTRSLLPLIAHTM
ncbi:hypothetical protein L3X38_012782 [Prunus dulcis]|uniref:Uncharacterized protein n=1 Tax=Prunus dulcis TaxID=3755 RepID=A0AAD4ZGD3_PRUDU|nr:hypothetical protein L3X38_012782 [Prunus dulcis]